MSNNLFDLKRRLRPGWYEDGPVKVFTREEIDEWEKGCHDDLWAKIDAQAHLSEKDIKYLDGLNLERVETAFSEILEGTSTDSSPPLRNEDNDV